MVLLRNIIGSAYATPQVKLYWQPFAECLREYVYDNGWNLGGNRSIGYSFGEIYNILLLHIPCRGVHTNEVCVPEDLPNSGFNMWLFRRSPWGFLLRLVVRMLLVYSNGTSYTRWPSIPLSMLWPHWIAHRCARNSLSDDEKRESEINYRCADTGNFDKEKSRLVALTANRTDLFSGTWSDSVFKWDEKRESCAWWCPDWLWRLILVFCVW